MTPTEAIILWNQPHNRNVAVTALRTDPLLQAALRAERDRCKEVDTARDKNGQAGCVITRDRIRHCEALLATLPQETK
jgi:hypothetical protein